MTKNKNAKINSPIGKVLNFHHLVFWVANAKTAASLFTSRFGFSPFASRNPTKDHPFMSLVVKLNEIIIVFQSPVSPIEDDASKQISLHGDFVKDVAFAVQDLDQLVSRAKEGGAQIVKGITKETDDEGVLRYAVLKTFGPNTHTLIDRSQYKGEFLPGYTKIDMKDPINNLMPEIQLMYIDHVESNISDGSLDDAITWYEKNLNLQRFWCVDFHNHDLVPYSCLNSGAVVNNNEKVHLTFNQTAQTEFLLPASKVQTYMAAFGDAGVEHVALYTDDIVSTMRKLKSRGAEIVPFPPAYYNMIREKLKDSSLNITESIDSMKENNILIDFDERGYMLQAFIGHLQPRPTVFLEIIQRRNHRGFGFSNYKWVYEAKEQEINDGENLLSELEIKEK